MLKPRTNKNFLFLRGGIANGLEAGAKNMTSGIKIYPLKDTASPTSTDFHQLVREIRQHTFPEHARLFRVSERRRSGRALGAIDPSQRGAIASIGIVKGQPFAPDERMRKLLTESAALGSATARAITFEPRIGGVYFYPDTGSTWSAFFANRNATFELDRHNAA